MDIIRVDHSSGNFTIISNAPARDNLSEAALGMLTRLLTLPPTWNFTLAGYITISTSGKKAIYSIINELIEKGYCRKVQSHGENGTFGDIVYQFTEVKGSFENIDTKPAEKHEEKPAETAKTVEQEKAKKPATKVAKASTRPGVLRYGAAGNVYLTQEEVIRLSQEIGPDALNRAIEKLSSYLLDNPNKVFGARAYSDHNRVLRDWPIREAITAIQTERRQAIAEQELQQRQERLNGYTQPYGGQHPQPVAPVPGTFRTVNANDLL